LGRKYLGKKIGLEVLKKYAVILNGPQITRLSEYEKCKSTNSMAGFSGP
jgi:hypothetical protein